VDGNKTWLHLETFKAGRKYTINTLAICIFCAQTEESTNDKTFDLVCQLYSKNIFRESLYRLRRRVYRPVHYYGCDNSLIYDAFEGKRYEQRRMDRKCIFTFIVR
jgi:hypothetical protein